jgi:hypothetical protein
LVDDRVLSTVSVINPINRCPQKLVPLDAYERFKSEYISLRDLSRRHGVGSRRLHQTLTDRGIHPVEKFKQDHCFVYRRKEVD